MSREYTTHFSEPKSALQAAIHRANEISHEEPRDSRSAQELVRDMRDKSSYGDMELAAEDLEQLALDILHTIGEHAVYFEQAA